jgi:hypothetical protein
MKLNSSHYQSIAELAPDQQQYHLGLFDIIQHAKVADTQLILCKRVGA